MKNTKRFAAVLACLLAVALLFTACSGKPKNIEAYLKNETVAVSYTHLDVYKRQL